jgi:hypothetical protein
MSHYSDYDDERIPCVMLGETRRHRARKEHPCSTCSRGIKVGTVYRRRRYIVDGEPTTEKVCDTCEAEEYGYGF